MILCDTGPLVAIFDKKDRFHSACLSVLPSLQMPLISSWPCFTEAMYLTFGAGGWKAQQALWKLRRNQKLILNDITEDEEKRMELLMEKYSDSPMDLADASLVVLAERLSMTQIFTLDGHFEAYRIHDKKPFEVVPRGIV